MADNNLIAELCQNHNGSVSLLKEMIIAAKESGIKYLKIQDIKSEDLTHRIRFDKGLIKNRKKLVIKRPFRDELLRLKKLDLPEKFIDIFIEECLRSKIYPIITPFTYSSLERIKNKKFKFLKIASYDCSALPFIKETNTLNKKLIVSTGATKLNEIKETVKFLKKKKQLAALLHCVSIYPTPMDKCNLNKIKFLKKLFGDIEIGWSDHSKFQDCGHAPALVSIIVGGSFIERHFTIVKKDKTKDGPVSINPSEAKTLLSLINKKKSYILDYLNKNYKDWELCLGGGSHKLTHEELLNRDYYRGRFATKFKDKYNYNWQVKKN
jgi:sialic acid synthase SpsE